MYIQQIIINLIEFSKALYQGIVTGVGPILDISNLQGYTSVVRWIFIALGLYILLRCMLYMLNGKRNNEVWGYLNVNERYSLPITHWENTIGRSKSSDLIIDDMSVSRNQGVISIEEDGTWNFMEMGTTNPTFINSNSIKIGEEKRIRVSDVLSMGATKCSIIPISLEERLNNYNLRKHDMPAPSYFGIMIALTLFQILAVVQLKIALGNAYDIKISVAFLGLIVLEWLYILTMKHIENKRFEMELIAFFLSTLSLSVTVSKYPNSASKQILAIYIGVLTFIMMHYLLSNLNYAKKLRGLMIVLSILILVFNVIFGKTIFGASNWIVIGGVSMQPSEIVKLAYIWAGGASLDELMQKKNSVIFTIFSAIIFVCLALMGDFGTALIFFVTFLVISFLRSGDLTKLILLVSTAAISGLILLKFKSYIAHRFAGWTHAWDFPNDMGFQQTRAMSSIASGGLVGVGAGNGWIKNIPASDTDLVFAYISQEWGLIIAIMSVLAIVTLTIFAVSAIRLGRSAFYTITACSAMSLFIFQTMLNVFGSLDMLPFTGVTFPFLSNGGTSMIASWGLLAFLKSADNRFSAAEKLNELGSDY